MQYQEITGQIVEHIREWYGVGPEFLWAKNPNNAAIRHPNNKKWFAALLLSLPRKLLGLAGEGTVDVIDLKCDPLMIGSVIDGARILPGYHMNKEHWITVLLDGSVPPEEIFPLIALSFDLIDQKKKKRG
ncbi:MAG: MmcQ/YjbR family DNA-binding protein [Butyricicoccus sp.]|nr:MmcQ/YjbR family DNA-binding protein [Butyricicoccus sp.]